jgi:hypothetical protein
MRKILIFGTGFLVVFAVLNLILLDFFVVSERSSLLDLSTRVGTLSDSFKTLTGRIYGGNFSDTTGQKTPSGLTTFPSGTNDSCSSTCIGLIRSATASAIKAITPPSTPTTTTIYTPSKIVNTVSKGEFFIPLGSGSVSSGTDWTDVTTAQAIFDAGNFGSIKAAYFEVFIHTDSGQVSARLFDTTTPAILFSSQVANSSSTSTFFSAPITLSTGNKTYRVQMKSTIATGVLDQARVRIIVQ